jgi:hypothetical protein
MQRRLIFLLASWMVIGVGFSSKKPHHRPGGRPPPAPFKKITGPRRIPGASMLEMSHMSNSFNQFALLARDERQDQIGRKKRDVPLENMIQEDTGAKLQAEVLRWLTLPSGIPVAASNLSDDDIARILSSCTGTPLLGRMFAELMFATMDLGGLSDANDAAHGVLVQILSHFMDNHGIGAPTKRGQIVARTELSGPEHDIIIGGDDNIETCGTLLNQIRGRIGQNDICSIYFDIRGGDVCAVLTMELPQQYRVLRVSDWEAISAYITRRFHMVWKCRLQKKGSFPLIELCTLSPIQEKSERLDLTAEEFGRYQQFSEKLKPTLY